MNPNHFINRPTLLVFARHTDEIQGNTHRKLLNDKN